MSYKEALPCQAPGDDRARDLGSNRHKPRLGLERPGPAVTWCCPPAGFNQADPGEPSAAGGGGDRHTGVCAKLLGNVAGMGQDLGPGGVLDSVFPLSCSVTDSDLFPKFAWCPIV